MGSIEYTGSHCAPVDVVELQAGQAEVCLVGMPNAGKTTVMNALTGGSFHTANYPGATVTLLRGRSRPELGPEIIFVDLPGVHSPINPSPEEELSCNVITGRHPSVRPSAFVLVVDVTQMERHLKFAGFVARQGKPVVVALTMSDMLPGNQSLNTACLASTLGVPVIQVDGRTGKGVPELISTLRLAMEEPASESPLASLPDEPVAAYKAVRELISCSGAVPELVQITRGTDSFTARVDRLVLHKYLGFPIFFLVLIGLFASIFWAARPFMDLIDSAFSGAEGLIESALPGSLLARFIAGGIIHGVGAVAVFFPQIVVLFFLMTLLEDSGYLARGAALVDRPLSYLGLHGRSFVPMLSGFACAIPAVFAARSIPARRERFLTIWIVPLMSCSARIPVYAILLAALLPGSAAKAGLALAAIYFLSLATGALTAGVISRFILKKKAPSILAMELPLYRHPQWKPIFRMTWSRASSYLRRAGTPIVIISSILWVLSNFGFSSSVPELRNEPHGIVTSTSLDHSFAAQLGKTMEPALRPMGVDWRVGVGMISAFAAREVFVSTMAIVFNVGGKDEANQDGLLDHMRKATFAGDTRPVFTTSSILGLMLFFFLSLQCFSTVAVVRKETGSWKFAAAQLVFYTGTGYLLSVAFVQGLRLLGVS